LDTPVSNLSDADLVARCRAGDADAWSELVERYARYVHAIVVQGFRFSPDEADDVFQDVFLKVYERLDSLRSDDSVRPWIAQLTRRCCLDRIRGGGSREVAVDEETPDTAIDEEIDRITEALDVHQALGTLSGECREILDRFFTRDESYRTIGDELGIPSGTIASRISRCLARLRTEIEGRK
jgi:RNA polymerase sigma factor (sigma-70 family)